MLELFILMLFSAGLILCVILNISILYALIFAYGIFFGYGLIKGKTWKDMLQFSLQGILTVKNTLIIFVLIGVITAVWRASGTIAFIVYYASLVSAPRVMLLLTFLLCSLASFLMGTAFGSAATSGVICMTLTASMHISPVYAGGAIFSGAHLIAELTKTNVFTNIKTMLKTAAVPFFITAAVYTVIGLLIPLGGGSPMSFRIFADYYNLSIFTVIPAAVILVFSFLKINVGITMATSSMIGLACAFFLQHIPAAQLIRILFFGFKPDNAELAALMSGGGILSMVRVSAIICISSCYSGMFKGTGFLDGIKNSIRQLSARITVFGGILVASIFTSAIACNQSLAIMLTHQLCDGLMDDNDLFASHLENTAVVIAPLMPWSIAVTVPLTSIGAPTAAIAAACYLYLIPLWNMRKR